MDDKIQHLEAWVRKAMPHDHGVIIPVSGGSDSALAFWLYATVLPEKTVGVYFGDALRAREWFERTGTMRYLATPASGNPEVARFATVLEIALAENRILVGTRNRTEDILGTYSTISRVASQQPLMGLFKSEVLALCEQVGVPAEIIASSREADPECGRPEALARIPFDAVDEFAKEKVGLAPNDTASLASDQRAYLEALYTRNQFKQQFPLTGPIF